MLFFILITFPMSHLHECGASDRLNCSSLSQLIDDLHEKQTRLRSSSAEISSDFEWKEIRKEVYEDTMLLFEILDVPRDMRRVAAEVISRSRPPREDVSTHFKRYMREFSKFVSSCVICDNFDVVLDVFEYAHERYMKAVDPVSSEIRLYSRVHGYDTDVESELPQEPIDDVDVCLLKQQHENGDLSDEEYINELEELRQREYCCLYEELHQLWLYHASLLTILFSESIVHEDIVESIDTSAVRGHFIEMQYMFRDWAEESDVINAADIPSLRDVCHNLEEMKVKLWRISRNITRQRENQFIHVKRAMLKCPIRQVCCFHRDTSKKFYRFLRDYDDSGNDCTPYDNYRSIAYYHERMAQSLEACVHKH